MIPRKSNDLSPYLPIYYRKAGIRRKPGRVHARRTNALDYTVARACAHDNAFRVDVLLHSPFGRNRVASVYVTNGRVEKALTSKRRNYAGEGIE